jgi:hypothetical protein
MAVEVPVINPDIKIAFEFVPDVVEFKYNPFGEVTSK